MRSEERIAKLRGTHPRFAPSERRPADGSLRARRRRPRISSRAASARRASTNSPARWSRFARTPSAKPTASSPPNGFTISAIASCAGSSGRGILPRSSCSRSARRASAAVQRVLGPARRWVAGAAAAGLAAGVFLGFAMDRRARTRQSMQAVQRSTSRAAAAAWQRRMTIRGTIRFFTEIDDALMGSRAHRAARDRRDDDPGGNPGSELSPIMSPLRSFFEKGST